MLPSASADDPTSFEAVERPDPNVGEIALLRVELAAARSREAALAERNQLLESVLAHMEDAVVASDREGRVLVMNPAMRRLVGVDATWKPPAEWASSFGLYRSDQVTPLPAEQVPLSRALGGETVTQAELFVRSPAFPDGSFRSVNARPLRDASGAIYGAIAVNRDVTERKRLEKALHQKDEMYRAIVQNLPSGAVFIFDRDLRFVVAEGPEVLSGVGLRKEDIEGRLLREVTVPENLAGLERVYRATLEGQTHHVEVRRSGRVFDVLTVPIRDSSDQVVGGLVKSYDVTARHEEAERLRTVTAQLAILLDHLSTGVVFADKRGRIQIVNRAMGMLLGMSNPAELVGAQAADPAYTARFDDPDGVARVVRDRSFARVPVIGDRLKLKGGRILERDYLPLETRAGFSGDLWCYRDVTDRERARAQLADQAETLRELSMRDELTRLNNRRGFMVLGEQQIKLADRAGRPVAVFFVDLNGMKSINDRLGHDEGDRALLDAANLLRQTFRDSDVIARLGGDEFVVLATDCPTSNVPTIQNRLVDGIDAWNRGAERRYQLSMSIGVAAYDPPTHEPRTMEQLLALADERMYEEKVRSYKSGSPRSSVICERPSTPPLANTEAWPAGRRRNTPVSMPR